MRELVDPGLVAAVHVELDDPELPGCRRGTLADDLARRAVREVVHRQLLSSLPEHPALALIRRRAHLG